MKNYIQIAIDGPAGAGKSTIAKMVAEKLGYTYIDTGAMYRAITYKAMNENINLSDGNAIGYLLEQTDIALIPSPSGQRVVMDGNDISQEIRSNDVTSNVSEVAAHANVRAEMVKRQLKMAASSGVVMDGRDIGTHVLVNAELKIFMSATVQERAKRRLLDNEARGIQSDIASLEEEIATRDKMDSEREASPLVQAQDAIFLDTTSMTIVEVRDEIIRLAEERLAS
ncbi:(d)CMP kinase [Paenisporosarcina cavernae]|uniref:Cytidylate kinase n=1 Tax=Paenisporosarcina cavernae TaxID=2320858 RepID=A0A385YRH4_9BACL|nr:(d)CMP kinase [Paenisporosarcina cavernae]AYC29375.1 (d)CMP kinase [Paenisporosarcina cavernae]